jgi:hypothetical protein
VDKPVPAPELYDLLIDAQCFLNDAKRYRGSLVIPLTDVNYVDKSVVTSAQSRYASILITDLEKIEAFVRYMMVKR